MDFTGMLSSLFGGNASAPYQMPTFGADGTQSTTQIGGDQNPILGWLSKNGGGLSSAATGLGQQLMQPKQMQAPQLQLNIPQAQRPQVQVPQITGMLNQPVAPANPFTGR
jgi:hypothetical protein